MFLWRTHCILRNGFTHRKFLFFLPWVLLSIPMAKSWWKLIKVFETSVGFLFIDIFFVFPCYFLKKSLPTITFFSRVKNFVSNLILSLCAAKSDDTIEDTRLNQNRCCRGSIVSIKLDCTKLRAGTPGNSGAELPHQLSSHTWLNYVNLALPLTLSSSLVQLFDILSSVIELIFTRKVNSSRIVHNGAKFFCENVTTIVLSIYFY